MDKMQAMQASYVKPRINSAGEFGVNHYAGEVIYDVTGFSDKNVENLAVDLLQLVSNSESVNLKHMFQKQQLAHAAMMSGVSPSGKKGKSGKKKNGRSRAGSTKIQGQSVGNQFKASLAGLIKSVNATCPNYVRCIKPNHDKQAGLFQAGEVLRQLKYVQ